LKGVHTFGKDYFLSFQQKSKSKPRDPEKIQIKLYSTSDFGKILSLSHV
jgi:hypothetical protein